MDPLTVSIVVSAPREQVFDYLQDIANHPQFTDHYLVDWHLTRLDSVGTGRRRALSREGARQPLQLGRRDVRARSSDRTESSRSGAPARTTASARSGVYELAPAAAGSTRVRFTLETVPMTLSDRLMEGLGGACLDTAQEPKAMHRLRGITRAGGGPRARSARHGRRWIDCRVACSAVCASSRSSCPPCSSFSAQRVRRLHTKVTTGTYAGEAGADAAVPERGPADLPGAGLAPAEPVNAKTRPTCRASPLAERKLEPGEEWFACSCRSTTTSNLAAPGDHRSARHRHPEQHLHPDPVERDQPVRLPRRAGAGQRQTPGAGHDRLPRLRPGPARCSTRSRSSRSTTARWRSRSSTRKTRRKQPPPSLDV